MPAKYPHWCLLFVPLSLLSSTSPKSFKPPQGMSKACRGKELFTQMTLLNSLSALAGHSVWDSDDCWPALTVQPNVARLLAALSITATRAVVGQSTCPYLVKRGLNRRRRSLLDLEKSF